MASVLILNGPNLNLLGTRQPEVYGKTTLADVEALCAAETARLELEMQFAQSNHEGALIDLIHEARGQHAGICLLYTSPSPRDRQKSRMPSSA